MSDCRTNLAMGVLLVALLGAGYGVTKLALRPKPTLWEAAAVGDIATVDRWLARGKGVNDAGLTGYAPLHFACGPDGTPEMVRHLIAAGATVDLKGPGDETPLMRAEQFGRDDLAEIVRAAGSP